MAEDERYSRSLRRQPIPCVALKGEPAMHKVVAEILNGSSSVRVLSMKLSSPVLPRKSSGMKKPSALPSPNSLHEVFKRPAVVVVFLTPETLMQKELTKAFEFLKSKKEVGPKPLVVAIGSSKGGGENLNPNSETIQLLGAHIKKAYKTDLKECFITWDANRIEASATLLKGQVENLCSAYYQALVSRKKKAIKPFKKSSKVADVYVFVRGAFMAGLLSEFQRQPEEALNFYQAAFNQLKVLTVPLASDEELEHVAMVASLVSFKLLTLRLGVLKSGREFKKHVQDVVALFRTWVKGSPGLVTSSWAHEWLARQHELAGELLHTHVSSAGASSTFAYDPQLSAFFHYSEAAQYLRNARSANVSGPVNASVSQYEERITMLLKRAYAEIQHVPVAIKRSKIRIAVMLAEEASLAGRHADALELCRRISNPAGHGEIARYKAESWWSLLGVVDAIAAQSAHKLDQKEVALRHALRCLSPAAKAPEATRVRMMELVLELRKQASPMEWIMEEVPIDALVAIDVRFENETAAPGALVAGTFVLVSRLPMAVEFDDLTLEASDASVKPFVEKSVFPLLLRSKETKIVQFACRAPHTKDARVDVTCALLQLGCISMVRLFEKTKRFFLSQVASQSTEPKLESAELKRATLSRESTLREPSPKEERRVSRRLTVESSTGLVDVYGAHMAAHEICPSLETLRGGLAVRGLELGCNNLANEGAGLVASWLAGGAAPQLGSLSLWNCGLGPQCGSHVATILRSCPGLRTLNLGLNAIGDGGIAAFARSLQIAPALEELVLWRVGLSKVGLIVLLENLLPPSRLRSLDIRSNELGDGCVGALSAFLSKSMALRTLLLADNPGLTRGRLSELALSITQTNFSVHSFGEETERLSRSLSELAKRNREVDSMLRNGTFSLPFKGLAVVPGILVQSTGFSKRLTHLDLSHNDLAALPAEFSQLENMTHCILSHNQLSELNVDLARLRSLVLLDVSHNTISLLPTELGLLPRLAHLLAANNSLQSMVPELFHGATNLCHTLREMDLSFNHLETLPGTLSNLRGLQKLQVSNNKLTQIFGGLSKLLQGSLTVCNLSNNCLATLPPTLSEYKECINIAGNSFSQFPPEVVARGPPAVWEYLEDMLHGEQIYPRIKLMFVGQGNVGKTTLLKALTGQVEARSKLMGFVTGKGLRKQTDGIEVDDWTPVDDVTFSTWDFAGQEVYYNTHQFFLSQRSLYLVVFSLAMSLQETNLLTWLNSLQVRAPGVPVFLIGTHADKKLLMGAHLTDVSEKIKAAVAKWSRLYRKDGRIVFVKPENSDLSFFPVSSIRKTGNGLAELKSALLKCARAQPSLKEHVPKIYLSLLDVVKRKRQELRDKPFVDWATLRSWDVIPDDKALRRACRLLHDWGDIISFQDGKMGSGLSDLVILDPNWLTMFLTTIVGVNSPLNGSSSASATSMAASGNSSGNLMNVSAARTSSSGSANAVACSGNAIIAPSALPLLWSRYPSFLYQPLCKLLERFEVWVKLSTGDYLVPCLLSSQPPPHSFHEMSAARTIGRVYVIPFCPHGFFSHLLLRIWSFCKIGQYWNSGCLLESDTVTALVEIRQVATEQNPLQAMVQLVAKGPGATALMTRLVFTLHSFIQDWYSGLTDHIVTLLPCVECLKQRTASTMSYHTFAANDLIRDYMQDGAQSDVIECPVCHAAVAVNDLVPELVGIAEGQGQYAHEVVEGRSIGMGGFAEVFVGQWQGREVAIKKLLVRPGSEAEDFTLQTFEDFAMEVHMVRQLNHPNVVKLYAAYSRPPAIVLEFVPMGSLDEVLKSMSGPLDWELVLRMASDVAKGLEYLHGFTPRILHRDLKSPNILVQSVSLDSPVLLKVADLGLSCFHMGNTSGTMIENPRWVAPETLQTGSYTDKSDVYSFGIILNELVTRQLPFHDITFNSEIEIRVKKGERPAMNPQALEKYNKLITECWESRRK